MLRHLNDAHADAARAQTLAIGTGYTKRAKCRRGGGEDHGPPRKKKKKMTMGEERPGSLRLVRRCSSRHQHTLGARDPRTP